MRVPMHDLGSEERYKVPWGLLKLSKSCPP